MFYGADAGLFFGEYCAACGFCYVLGNSIYDGLAGKVDTLYFVSVVFGCGVKGYCEVETCVQSFTEQ